MAHKLILRGIERFGPQLANSRKASVVLGTSQKISVDYCSLKDGSLRRDDEVIVLLAGFGSGWTGISKLGYGLAKLGHEVCMVSMPGYGNSDDPDRSYFEGGGFDQEVFVLKQFAQTVLPDKKIHWAGHSMAARIIVQLAASFPLAVASLILLNPAGFESRGMLGLGFRFVLNGMMHAASFRGDPVWTELKKFLPKEKSPFSSDRLRQRLSEWRRLCVGDGMDFMRKLPQDVQMAYISSERDFVFPSEKSAILKYERRFIGHVRIINGLWHNTTMFGSDLTAKAIDEWLFPNVRRC